MNDLPAINDVSTQVEARIQRKPKPEWLRVKAPTSPEYAETRNLMRRLKLNTVCEEAACPNIGECLEEEARDGDDPGGHLHPGLCLLQHQDRDAAASRS